MRPRFAVFLLVAFLGCLVISQILVPAYFDRQFDPPQPTVEPPLSDCEPIPRRQVAAYEKIGGVAGDWWSNHHMPLEWSSDGEPEPQEGGRYTRRLPGFRFRAFPKAKLPAVSVPFGLQLTECDVTGEQLLGLAHLVNLRLVMLKPGQVTDAILRSLRDIGRLQALYQAANSDSGCPPASADAVTNLWLEDAAITDAGIKELAPFRNLSTLSLRGTRISNAGLREIAKLQLDSLTTLRIEGTRATPAGFKELVPLRRLSLLAYLDPDNVDDAFLRGMREANLLHAWNPAVTNNGKRARSENEVTTLSIWSEKITAAGLRETTAFTNLEALDIRLTKKLGAALLKELHGFVKLKSLRISGSLDDAAWKEVGSINSLRSLTLWDTNVDGPGIEYLVALKNLKDLHLCGSTLTVDGCASLSKLEGLESLELHQDRGIQATDACMPHLARMKNLRNLFLRSSKLTDAGVKELAALTKLEELYLWTYDSPVTEAGRAALEQALPRCKIFPLRQ
jgi:hypothetical protein